MEQVKEREQQTTEVCEASRRKAQKAHKDFERVKSERYRRFQDFFEPVSSRIDEIYKACGPKSVLVVDKIERAKLRRRPSRDVLCSFFLSPINFKLRGQRQTFGLFELCFLV